VLGLATWSLLRDREGRRTDLPRQTRGHTGLELVWTAVPAVTIGILFLLTLAVLARVDDVSPADDANAPRTEVDVTAFRWGWTFTYPGTDVTVSGSGLPGPEVVVPVGEPIVFRLHAADVVHSFYVPLFLFKRDVVPGRENVFEVTVEEAGSYGGQCAEFCGLYHSRMPFTVRAVDRTAFDAWLASQPRSGASASPGASQ
jgi:cytochrome c oxidase subunit 2